MILVNKEYLATILSANASGALGTVSGSFLGAAAGTVLGLTGVMDIVKRAFLELVEDFLAQGDMGESGFRTRFRSALAGEVS